MGSWKYLHVSVDQRVALSLNLAKWEPCSWPTLLLIRLGFGEELNQSICTFFRSSSEYLNPCPCRPSQASFLILSSLDCGLRDGQRVAVCRHVARGWDATCMYMWLLVVWSGAKVGKRKRDRLQARCVCVCGGGGYGSPMPPQNLRESQKFKSELSLLDSYKNMYGKIE